MKSYSCFINIFGRFLILYFCLLFPVLVYSQKESTDKEKEILDLAYQALISGSYDSALNLYGKLLQIRIEIHGENSVPVANVLSNLGTIKSKLGLYDEAIPLYEKALSIYEPGGISELKHLASVFQNLGICFYAKGDIEQAKNFYENAERIIQKLDLANQDIYEYLLINMTNLYLDNKRIAEAEKYNEKAFGVHSNSIQNFKKWNSRGLISLARKEYDKSITLLKKAIQIGEKDLGADFTDKGLIYMNLGMAFLQMGDFERSVSYYKLAQSLIEQSAGKQNISYSSCLKDIGLNYLQKKESESNLESFLVLRKNNISAALDYFQDALIAITPGFTAKEWQNNPVAEEAIDKTLLLEVLKNKAETFHLLSQLEEKQGNSESSLKQLKSALLTYDLAIKTIRLIRQGFQNQESRLFLSENEHPVYAEAVEVAVNLYEKSGDRQYFEKGFEISERSRSADFQTMLRELQAKKISDLPDSLIQKEAKLKKEISAYENFIFNEKSIPTPDLKKIDLWKDKVFSLTQNYQQVIGFIEKNFPHYYQYKYTDPTVSVQKIQQSLNRREAFVEFFINEGAKISEGELYTFVITDHEYKIIRKPLNPDFETTIDQFLSFIKNSAVLSTRKADYIQYAQNAHKLYKLLIEPVTKFMENYRLVIVPDDKLSYLPFDAFLASAADTSKMDFRNLDYLVHHHAISYTYSATLLYYYFQNSVKYSTKIGAFAPDYSDQPLAFGSITDHLLPLPGAEAEVAGVTDLFSGDQYFKTSATKQKFLENAEKYDILHLAMHTILNDTLPLYSKMVFSKDSIANNERSLNTFEIYNLRLKSDMVVLSGCSTGTGKLQKGEGVMSLARGFLFAGCPSIIMTLWNVEDASSSAMMMEFYRNLKNGFSKDEALRRAKISYISRADPFKAHPHFWLGYVSIGKQNPLFKTKAGYFVGLIIFVFLAIVLEKWYFKRKKKASRLR